jgi:hypothetical protein
VVSFDFCYRSKVVALHPNLGIRFKVEVILFRTIHENFLQYQLLVFWKKKSVKLVCGNNFLLEAIYKIPIASILLSFLLIVGSPCNADNNKSFSHILLHTTFR